MLLCVRRWTAAARRARPTTATARGSTSVVPSRKCSCRRPAASLTTTTTTTFVVRRRRTTTTTGAATPRCRRPRHGAHHGRTTRTVASWTPFSFPTTTSRVARFALRFRPQTYEIFTRLLTSDQNSRSVWSRRLASRSFPNQHGRKQAAGRVTSFWRHFVEVNREYLI